MSNCPIKIASYHQNHHWKLGQLFVLILIMAYIIFFSGIKLFVLKDKKLKFSASIWKRISKFQLNHTINRKNGNNNFLNELNYLKFCEVSRHSQCARRNLNKSHNLRQRLPQGERVHPKGSKLPQMKIFYPGVFEVAEVAEVKQPRNSKRRKFSNENL